MVTRDPLDHALSASRPELAVVNPESSLTVGLLSAVLLLVAVGVGEVVVLLLALAHVHS